MAPGLHKHGLPVNAVESIAEVQEERPALAGGGGRHQVGGCV